MSDTVNRKWAVAELTASYSRKIDKKTEQLFKINRSEDSHTLLREIMPAGKISHVEMFVVLLLNRSNQVTAWACISIGGMNSTIVDPKILMQYCLLGNASGFIVAHNHPSGATRPSEQDIRLTKRIKDAADILDLALLDHIIVGGAEAENKTYYSFADEGQL